jgi:hypothetical protein
MIHGSIRGRNPCKWPERTKRPDFSCETVSNLGGLPAMVRAVDRVEHRESGMIRVAMTYRLCSPAPV